MLITTSWSHAASFDCSNAKTRIEHLICDHPELGRLDDELGNVFQTALGEAADPSSLVQSQREWIKTRNRCIDVECLENIYSKQIASIKNVKHAQWKTYSDPDLGISFEYPGNRWIKKPCRPYSGNRCVALAGRNMGTSDYIIAFEVVAGTLAKVATDEAGFSLEEGKWVVSGDATAEVESFDGPGWKGMRAASACEVFDPESGPHTGFCINAVISNGKRAVVTNTEGSIGDDADTARSIESIRFLK
ncbi:lysozyme inhibitor LprI family protein [Paraburkholderia sp. J67]|uniref:lysozyme inhibitor LprI family protein n=1 Tax=Paraburkholderia sp. J67 TaxID=2805435 RepID=UPI002ABD3AF5|nr:lysozyme inhibitor LprI family protein [Paraburkholderia sp. J67]